MWAVLEWLWYLFGGVPLFIGFLILPIAVTVLLVVRVREQVLKAVDGYRRPPLSHVTDGELRAQREEAWPVGWPDLTNSETNSALRCHAYSRLAGAVAQERDHLGEFLLLVAGASLGVTLPHFFESLSWRLACVLPLLAGSASVLLRLNATTWRRRALLYETRGRHLERRP